MKPTKGNWRPGNNNHCIVTDSEEEISKERDSAGSIAYYGGALIAESIKACDIHVMVASKELFAVVSEAITLRKEAGLEVPKHWQSSLDKANGIVKIESISEAFVNDVKASIEKGESPFDLNEKQWPESSQISRTKFIPEESVLKVEFKATGKIYHYLNFPAILWNDLVQSKSIGQFINKQVKGQFEYKIVA